MDISRAGELKSQIEQALVGMGGKLNSEKYAVSIGNVRFDSRSVKMFVEIVEKDANGVALSREAEMLRDLGKAMFGLPADALGKKFEFHGHQYEACGLAPRSAKYPLLAKRVASGTVYKLPASAMGGTPYLRRAGFDRTEWAEARGS